MRYLVATAVVIMLFILPAISWWYLQSGFNYRKKILNEIEAKRTVLSNSGIGGVDSSLTENLSDKITVLASASNLSTAQSDILLRLKEKYGKRELFQVVSTANDKYVRLLNMVPVHQDSIYLVDNQLMIRHVYSWKESEVKMLVEHTAALLPIPKRETVSLKRDLPHESEN